MTTTKGTGRFAVLYLLGVIANMCASFQAPLVMPLAQVFHVEPKVIGLVMSAQFLPYLFCGSAAGALVARIGIGRAARLGLLLIVVTSTANRYAPSLVMFVASNLLQGFGMLITVVAGQIGAAAIATDDSRARLIAAWATAPLVGLAMGLLLSSQFADGAAWRVAFLVLAALAAILLVPTIVLPAAVSAPPPSRGVRGGGLMKEAEAFRVTLAVAFLVVTVNGSVSCWPTFLSRVHDTTPGRIGGISSMALLVGVAGSLCVGLALGRGWSVRRLSGLIIPVALASAIVVFGAFTGLGVAIVGMVFWQLATGAMTGLLFATLPGVLRNPANLPAATGLLYQGAALGTIFGAPIYLWLTGLDDPTLALTLLTGCALIGVALAMPVPRRVPPPMPSTSY